MVMMILQIVGYQNSGKTTLIEKIIHQLCENGYRVGTLKHHGHGGKVMLPKEKDTTRHAEAGAMVCAVEGDGTFLLHAKGNWELDELLCIYERFPIDVLLIEGFKHAAYPKIVCLRHREDEHLLHLKNILFSISWQRTDGSFFIEDEQAYMERIIAYVEGEEHVCDRS
ncbi:molybdopterin-guanine dinucleotide biosynthesis protein B [Anoxybacillus flavithermus NBRC 109594]|uniref:Molybdopterin-guanine dinucleotide biosynthesis protein B n=1 Tax=Anoxybacillus flavithermus NBRC 109594 TaxID=1315967 RepID=R4FAI4_9BACL|nr:molybdopterin-guanine dinucleotide biosynthesis protein B [Anoxybacillus flavithermus]GAC89780.1 molybdopterin-guanine dinucleotide biosynthesis protein B [Anoxybacillus flavithermus NBRC 109594]